MTIIRTQTIRARPFGGFSAPFEQWVIDGWRRHSNAIGGTEIARRWRQTLADPVGTKRRAMRRAGKR